MRSAKGDTIMLPRCAPPLSVAFFSCYCRERLPYIQLREATVLAQALTRGRRVRAMLPKLRKEKAQRDVSSM